MPLSENIKTRKWPSGTLRLISWWRVTNDSTENDNDDGDDDIDDVDVSYLQDYDNDDGDDDIDDDDVSYHQGYPEVTSGSTDVKSFLYLLLNVVRDGLADKALAEVKSSSAVHLVFFAHWLLLRISNVRRRVKLGSQKQRNK